MKHITLVCIAALFACSAQGQVIFENGFENWTGTAPSDTPDGWMGSKTQLDTANVEQVTMDIQEGASAARLIQTASTHQRFTTQPLTVESGVVYNVSFYARGNGDVRLGIFDGRPGNGYSSYTNYTVVNSATWQQVNLSIAAAMDTDLAEFILSVRLTMAPEHLVIDNVTITAGGIVEPPVGVTIQEIQMTSDPGGDSPLLGQIVLTGGIVTAVAGNGFYIQNGGGPWSGIFVFSTQIIPTRGDSLRFSATVAEFNNSTQLTFPNDHVVVSSGHELEVVTITATEAVTEPFESVLARVMNATATNLDPGPFQWLVNDGTGDLRVDEELYPYSPTLGTAYNITGVIRFAFGDFRIVPRDMNDIDVVTSIAENGIFSGTRIFPNPASDVVAIELPLLDQRTEFLLLDASGRMVASNIITSDRAMIDVATLPNGIYALTLRSEGAVWSTRVVVAR